MGTARTAPAEQVSATARMARTAPTAPTARLVRCCGALGLVGVVFTVWLGLWVTPPDAYMGNLVRLLYIHPSMAWDAFLAYGVSFLASACYLWPRTRDLRFDRIAGASAEAGVVFTGLTLITGSLWGRPTWGTWWTWDPLLTTTALLFVLYLGYLALRKVPGEPETQARRSAIGALVAFVDVPIVYFSVTWWHSLHQAPTITAGKTDVHGSMAWTLLLSFVSFTLVYLWMIAHRYRLGALQAREEQEGLALALAERRAEGILPVADGALADRPVADLPLAGGPVGVLADGALADRPIGPVAAGPAGPAPTELVARSAETAP